MIHLDTNFLVLALAAGSAEDRRLRNWLRAEETLGVSAIVWSEFLCGPVEARHVELVKVVVKDPIPFLVQDAEVSARLFNFTGRRRGTLTDCMIAATAIRQGAALATANVDDFRGFEPHGLRLSEH